MQSVWPIFNLIWLSEIFHLDVIKYISRIVFLPSLLWCFSGGSLDVYKRIPEHVLGRIAVAVSFILKNTQNLLFFPSWSVLQCDRPTCAIFKCDLLFVSQIQNQCEEYFSCLKWNYRCEFINRPLFGEVMDKVGVVILPFVILVKTYRFDRNGLDVD